MLTASDRRRLVGVDPILVAALEKLDEICERAGCAIFFPQGLRTAEYQASLFAQGRTKPGKIVTNADGIPKEQGGHGVSNHQARANGWGAAVDFAFVDDPRTPKDETWDEAYWKLHQEFVWAEARKLGLKCGADWPKPDRPHLELPVGVGSPKRQQS